MQHPQQGSRIAVVITVVAVLALISFVTWRLYESNQQQTNTQNQSNNTQPQPDPNQGYVVIKEWGVRFKPVEGLIGVQYFKPKDVITDAISITTEELGNKEPGCSINSESMVLGLLTRSKEPQPVDGGVIAKIGDYSFQYRSSGASCGTPENSILIDKAWSQIVQSIKSLEAAK